MVYPVPTPFIYNPNIAYTFPFPNDVSYQFPPDISHNTTTFISNVPHKINNSNSSKYLVTNSNIKYNNSNNSNNNSNNYNNGNNNNYINSAVVCQPKKLIVIIMECISRNIHDENVFNSVNYRMYLNSHLRTFIINYLIEETNVSTTITNNTMKQIGVNLEEFTVPPLLYLGQKAVRECVINSCNTLIHLNLSTYWKISSTTLQDIFKICNQLRSVQIQQCVHVSNDTINLIVDNCKFLKSLNISGCNLITDKSLKCISLLDEIEELKLSKCYQLTDNGFRSVFLSCTQLEVLDLSYCKITDSSGKLIANKLTKLTKLNIEWCSQLTETVIQSILRNCSLLLDLNINRCNINGKTILEISKNLTQIQRLNIGYADKITPYTLYKIRENCTNLVHLNISGSVLNTKYIDAFTKPIGTCNSITIKYGKNVTTLFEIISTLHYKTITSINLNYSSFSLPSIFILFSNGNIYNYLKELKLTICESDSKTEYVPDDLIRSIVSCCPQIESLSVGNWRYLSDSGIHYLTPIAHKLVRLSLKNCNRITHRGLSQFIRNAFNLKYLNLSGTAVNDNTIFQMSFHCTKLQTLNLSHNKNITKNSIRSIAKTFVMLNKLQLIECTSLADETLKIIGEIGCFPNLKYLALMGCKQITKPTIRWFNHRRPFTQIVYDSIKPLQALIIRVPTFDCNSPVWDFNNVNHDWSVLPSISPALLQKLQTWTENYKHHMFNNKNHNDDQLTNIQDLLDQVHKLLIELKFWLGADTLIYDQLEGYLKKIE